MKKAMLIKSAYGVILGSALIFDICTAVKGFVQLKEIDQLNKRALKNYDESAAILEDVGHVKEELEKELEKTTNLQNEYANKIHICNAIMDGDTQGKKIAKLIQMTARGL